MNEFVTCLVGLHHGLVVSFRNQSSMKLENVKYQSDI